MTNIVVITLTNGSSILCEVLKSNIESAFIEISKPFGIVFHDPDDPIKFHTALVVPFTDSEKFPLNVNHILFISDANEYGRNIYGNSLLQFKLDLIKSEVATKITGDETLDYHLISDALLKMKDLSSSIAEKYSIQHPDFSEMEEKLASMTPVRH